MPDTRSDERSSPGTIDCDSAMDDAGVGSVFPIREPGSLLLHVCCAQLHSAAQHSWQNCYMDIGIIGSGKMVTGLGRLWAKHGHHVMFSYSRRPEKLEILVLEIDSHAR